MIVKELKQMLEEVDENMEVVFGPENSDYLEDFGEIIPKVKIGSFWGDDYQAVAIVSGGQVGSVIED